jgi:DNA-binding XRE family transcriptional regulator
MRKKIKYFKIGPFKAYNFDNMLKERLKSPKFRKAYEEELARLSLMRDIREARIAKKLTQKQVAKKAGMSQSVVARLESGSHPFSLSTLYRIANVFGKKIVLA